MDLDADVPLTRRRGAELERALLDAAWAVLEDVGYGGFTFDAVAARAETSRSVIYRRWADRESLAIAAVRRHFDGEDVETPDTGSLRGDMIERLRNMSDRRAGVAVMISAQLAGLFAPDGLTLSEARDKLVSGAGNRSDAIFERAHARGEINLDTLPESVRNVPIDLLRQRLLLTRQAVPEDYIITIVDEIFMPLVAHYQAG